jgi:hypothetical protein
LDNDEEEVEDLHAMWHIEEILHATYESKIRGQGSNAKEGSPFHIRISVEPTTPCVTKTFEEEEPFRKPTISDKGF